MICFTLLFFTSAAAALSVSRYRHGFPCMVSDDEDQELKPLYPDEFSQCRAEALSAAKREDTDPDAGYSNPCRGFWRTVTGIIKKPPVSVRMRAAVMFADAESQCRRDIQRTAKGSSSAERERMYSMRRAIDSARASPNSSPTKASAMSVPADTPEEVRNLPSAVQRA